MHCLQKVGPLFGRCSGYQVFFQVFLLLAISGCVNTPDPDTTGPQARENRSKNTNIQVGGHADPALQLAAQRVVDTLGEISALADLTADSGLLVYPPFSCEPNQIERPAMTTSSLADTFVIANCHESDAAKWAVTTWGDFFAELRATAALQDTDKIVLNERYGIGIDTGTSFLAETKFPAESFKFAIYFNLGGREPLSRDWDEVGFVFDNTGEELKLVAIYRDYFSAI